MGGHGDPTAQEAPLANRINLTGRAVITVAHLKAFLGCWLKFSSDARCCCWLQSGRHGGPSPRRSAMCNRGLRVCSGLAGGCQAVAPPPDTTASSGSSGLTPTTCSCLEISWLSRATGCRGPAPGIGHKAGHLCVSLAASPFLHPSRGQFSPWQALVQGHGDPHSPATLSS